MPARLEIELKCDARISQTMASLFHGALMELIPTDYAEQLHLSQLHPYSQHLELRNDKWYWVVSGLNERAEQIILDDALGNRESVFIRDKEMQVCLAGRKRRQISYEELAGYFYREKAERQLHLRFVSPAAFKRAGQYLFYPDIRCIYQSLMNRYSAAAQENMLDEDALEQLTQSTRIVSYQLKSVNFHLEGVRIPSFVGEITIRIGGTQTMANFARILFEFGTYSGVGIKTALGMGAYQIINREGRR